jgi:hypothetical protein
VSKRLTLLLMVVNNKIMVSIATVFRVTFVVLTAVTNKNAVFWDIKTQFVLNRRHITSPLQSPAG